MVVKTLLKRGIKKLTKKKPKTKPTPRYRTDPKTGERFLNRRAKVSGVKGLEEYRKKNIRDTGIAIGAGVLGGAGIGYNFAKSKKGKETQAKLKEATEKHREKDKKKKEKRKDNYGGR